MGDHFGPKNSILGIEIGGESVSNVTWFNNSKLTYISPPLKTDSLDLLLTAGGQTNSQTMITIAKYSIPVIISLSPTLPVVSAAKLTLHGNEFANVPISSIAIWSTEDNQLDVLCTGITRMSYSKLTCSYPLANKAVDGCDNRKMFVRISGQYSKTFAKLCFCGRPLITSILSTHKKSKGGDTLQIIGIN